MGWTLILALVSVAFALFMMTVKVLREYQRVVVFTLGRFSSVLGPGLVLVIPGIQQTVRVDLRTVTQDIPSQDLITRDNVSVKVNAVLYFRVMNPQKAIINIENYVEATGQLAQTTLRSVLGQHDLDGLLAERDRLNEDIQTLLDSQTDQWGIKVANVEIKHVDIDESMVRAIARQAEAERERRAKVIHADGEAQAAEKLVQAATTLASEAGALQLRYLQTLTEIAGDRSNTIVFPLDLIRQLGQTPLAGPHVAESAAPPEAAPTDTMIPEKPTAGVEANPGEVEANPGEVEADPGEVEADPGKVEADPGKVEADPGKVEADPGEVEADPGKV